MWRERNGSGSAGVEPTYVATGKVPPILAEGGLRFSGPAGNESVTTWHLLTPTMASASGTAAVDIASLYANYANVPGLWSRVWRNW